MEWVGRRVFERGYWKSGEEKNKEIEVLDASEAEDVTDGIIEDEDDDDGPTSSGGSGGETGKGWTRIVRCAVSIAQTVNGFRWIEGTRDWRIEGVLEHKVRRWKEEAMMEREAEESRRRGTRWADDAMDVDDDILDDFSEESEDDEDDTAEVKALEVIYPIVSFRIQLTRSLSRLDADICIACYCRQTVHRMYRLRHQPAAVVLVPFAANPLLALLCI
jgi:hypothetical protein